MTREELLYVDEGPKLYCIYCKNAYWINGYKCKLLSKDDNEISPKGYCEKGYSQRF